MAAKFSLSPEAVNDLVDIWRLVAGADGVARADRLVAKIEAFCFSAWPSSPSWARGITIAGRVSARWAYRA
ncbi:MAG: hypothetical protein ACLPKB_07165 [Xanthobacteraceae bacterium]